MLQVDSFMLKGHIALLAFDVLSSMEPLHVVLVPVGGDLRPTLITNLGVDLFDFVDDWFGLVDGHVFGQEEL